MSEVIIRIADEADLSVISNFIQEHFVKFEPILTGYQFRKEKQSSHSFKEEDYLFRDCILNRTSFVAHDLQNQLVGVAIAGRIGPNESAETLELAKVTKNQIAADIFKFIAFVEEKADVCNRLSVPESLHLHIISVHKNYHGNGIAGKLFKALYENAIEKSYLALSVDCTNFYTSKIANRYNMELLSTVSYDEYNDHVGVKTFIPKEPHMIVRSYGIKLNNN